MNQVHRLLMIGVDHPALEVAAPDVEITVLLGAPTKDGDRPLPAGARVVFADDHKNVDSVLNALYRAGHGEGSFDAVYAHDDPALMTAAVVATVLGARSVPPATVSLFRDKYLQKQRVRAAGIPVAGHDLIQDIRELPEGYRLPFPRAVVKPVAGMATQSTYVVASDDDLARVSAQCRTASARTFVVEEFVEGEEWFADGIISGGEIRFLALGRYAQPCLSAVQQRAPVQTFSLDPTADAWAFDLARPLVSASLAALGLRDGIFHLEMFHNAATGTLTFSECAARRAGGPIRDQIRYKYGVDLAEYCVRVLLEPVGEITPKVRDGVVASTFLPLKPGIILGYPPVTELVSLPDVVHARMFVPVGLSIAAGAANTFFRMGEITVQTQTMDQAQERLAEVAAWFTDRVDVLPISPTLRALHADPHNAGFRHAAGG